MMKRASLCLLLLVAGILPVLGQSQEVRFLFIGAHPDDADLKGGGTAAMLATMGHPVKFLSVTSGDAGHHEMGGGELARRRFNEAQESARRLGISYEILHFHDGELIPSLAARHDIIRAIREWDADVVVSHRPNDYHPDHRYSGILVQDAAILVQVPNVLPTVEPLAQNPVFLYFEDSFQRPYPFIPHIAIAVDDVYDQKISALDAHASQFHEYLPLMSGDMGEPPSDETERIEWLKLHWTFPITPEVRAALVKWYGAERGNEVQHSEAFEIAEYGTQPSDEDIRHLFPMLPR